MNDTTRRLLALMKERYDLANRVDHLEEVLMQLRGVDGYDRTVEGLAAYVRRTASNALMESSR